MVALPVVLWLNVGQVKVPVLKLPEVGVPSNGVTSVGLVDKTFEPEPVEVVTPVPPAKTGKVPAVSVVAPVEYTALLAAEKVVRPVPPYAPVIVPPFQVPPVTTVVDKRSVFVPQSTSDGTWPYAIHVPATVALLSNT